jgi:hypothetical protein
MALLLGLVSAAAADEAKVIKLTGTAEMMLPGATAATPLALNSQIPEGATVTTAAGAELSVEAMPGVIATIKAASTVVVEKLSSVKNGDTITEQTATLNLKQGNIVSTLDPAKKAINRYGVRTPKGVAAARGTVYAVKVDVTGSSIATLSGTVTIDLGGGNVLTIPVGTASANGEASQAIADAIKANPALANDIAEAVTIVAANVASGSSAVGTAESATAVLASVVNAASAALPNQAATFTQQAVQAIASPTSAVSTSGSGASAAIAAVTEAAVQGAVQSTAKSDPAAAQQLAQEITNSAVSTAKSSNAAVTAETITNAAATGAATGATNAGATTPPTVVVPSTTTTGVAAPTVPVVVPPLPVVVSPSS